MSSKNKDLNDSFLILIPLAFILVTNHYLAHFEYFNTPMPEWIYQINSKINDRIYFAKGSLLIFVGFYAFLNAQVSDKSHDNIAYLIIALIMAGLFMKGFLPSYYYNLYGYPIVFFCASYFTIKAVQYFSAPNHDDDTQGLFPQTKKTNKSFDLSTPKGPIYINKPEYGIGIEGGAGAGKSVLIKQILNQACNKGFAGVLYDFEGDCTEPGGADLTRTIMTALHHYNNNNRSMGRVGFAYLNFADPSRTVRVNPLSPKYISSSLDLTEFATTLMTNLEPEWLKKKDFWASNAIAYCNGILQRLYNSEHLHKYMTIPHLATICSYDYEAVFAWMLEDEDLHQLIMPLYVAYKEQAKQQLAGAVASTSLPITKLLNPEIFYPLSPQTEDETFDLDITNDDHPVFFSVGSIPKLKHSLGPVCSLILLVCMNNMNRFGKRRSLFVVDELPTIFIPNLDHLPATARKKDVSTILAWQSFKQLENAYGKEKAEITRDNLSNQFLGKTRNTESAERITKYFGKIDVQKVGYSHNEDSSTISYNIQKDDVLQAKDILNQPIGHFTGILASGQPPLFHTQFDNFEPKLKNIPYFAKRWTTDNNNLDNQLMKNEVIENKRRIDREIKDLLKDYKPVDNNQE